MNVSYDIPDCSNGEWRIETFVVGKNEFSESISFWKSGRGVPEGNYKRLMRGRNVIMSNTPDEIRDFLYFVRIASGNILISGLGMGLVIKALLEKDDVKKITVIELSKDLIDMVGPYFKDNPRVEIINADIFKWKPEKHSYWDYIWHDIWDYICSDNVAEMKTLHRKFGKYSKHQQSWCREICERQLKQDKKFGY